jgi:pimeloyl-ACP methyl ester carboxylesterase
MNLEALTALLDKIGPSIVLVHSQGGSYVWPLAQARPNLVKSIIAAEPIGPPAGQRVARYGLSDTPLAYMPPVTGESPLKFVKQEQPEERDLAPCWRQEEPARKLVGLGEQPVMVMQSEASFQAVSNHCEAEYLQQAGVKVDLIKLPELGIHGNGHMMMAEKNSDQIAQVIVDWLQKSVTPLEGSQRAAQ